VFNKAYHYAAFPYRPGNGTLTKLLIFRAHLTWPTNSQLTMLVGIQQSTAHALCVLLKAAPLHSLHMNLLVFVLAETVLHLHSLVFLLLLLTPPPPPTPPESHKLNKPADGWRKSTTTNY